MPTEPSLNSVNDLKVYFILKTNSVDECSQTIMRCLDCIRSLKISTQWISENECLKIQNFKKSDVFVIEEFDGSSFDHLSYHSSECLIISPSCIEYCLFENVPIPYNKYPVFSLAMEKLVITLSSTSRRNKDDAKKKVRCMCGYYSDNLLVSTTHLIVSKIMSEKYHKACESNIPVFTFNWINVVWNDSCTDFKIKATDTKYEKFKCPIFYNLNVTLTGLENTEQSECMEHINKNGGTCTDTIENNTDVLVMGIFIGDQFRCARNRGIPCVKTNWVYKSIEKGYAVRFDSHLVDDLEQYDTTQQAPNSSKQSGFKFVHSSPENGNHIDVLIANQNTTSYQSATKDKIVSLKPPPVACVTPQKKNRTRDKSYKQILNDISVGDIRQCGLILDGCKIYLSGFSPSEEDKLRRIINYGGATRFTELDESLTHIIVGNSNENFEDQINSMHNKPHVVRLEWLKDSIFKKYTLSEDQYNYFDNIRNNRSLTPLEEPSPLSKKGLQILTPKKVPINERVPSRTNVIADMHLLQEYSQPLPEDNFTTFENNNEVTGNKHVNVINNECTEDAVSNFSQKVADENVFKGLTFKVVNHDEGTTAKITEKIILYGGYVIERNKFTVPDYTVVPIANSSTSSRCGKLVTFIWLNDCISNKNIMPILYYHRSIAIPQWNHLPLRDCIITFSGYYPAEKKFIEHIAIALGAKCQETLSKKFNEKANALRNTHLVCRVPNGNKFKAAKKWSLPIVTKDWLMQCLNVGQRVAESDFALSAEPADDTKPEATGNEDKFNISEALRKTLSSSTKAAGQNVSNIQKEPLSDVRVNDVTATNKDQSNDRLPSPVTFRDINPKFHSTMKPLEQQLKKNPSETASSPLTTFANMNPKFHSTMKPIAEPKKKTSVTRKTRSSSRNQNSPFPPLKNLSFSRSQNTPVDEEETYDTPVVVTTHCTVTSTVSTPVTTTSCSINKNEAITTYSKLDSNMTAISPTTAAAFGHIPNVLIAKAKSSNSKNEAQCTPDGLLQQVKEMSQMLSNPKFGEVQKQKGIKYPFEDPRSRCVKRKFINVPEGGFKVGWNDQSMESSNKKLRSSGRDNFQTIAEESANDSLLAKFDLPEDDPPLNEHNNEEAENNVQQHITKNNDVGCDQPAGNDDNENSEKRFMLSNFSNLAEKKYVEETILKLGGKILTSSYFDKQTTHIITTRLLKSEKILCCIAAGKWILHPTYISDSGNNNKFLPEKDYEWGSNNIKNSYLKNEPSNQLLADATVRWREKITQSKNENTFRNRPPNDFSTGAFSGMKATLWTDSSLAAAFTRVIESGGGTILPYSEVLNATHVLIGPEDKYISSIPFSLQPLARKGIHVLPTTYLNEYLTLHPVPDPKLCYLDIYKKIIKNLY